MPYKIAIASSDGESVNQHFGQATNLLIYEIGDESVTFVEEREIALIHGEAAHTEQNTALFAGALHDCSALFVMRIGRRSLRSMLEKNIMVFEVDFSLNHIFNTLLENERRGRIRLLKNITHN
jgi:predicted Fe-Mo cluster-binding NifX family protein